MADSLDTSGGAYINRDVTAGTFIGRDQIIVLTDYSAAQLGEVLPRLREVLTNPQAELRADVPQGRLTVVAPDAPRVVLSEQAARDLLPAAARQADEGAYLTALRVNPRYGRWARQFVPLSGVLTTYELPPGWVEIPPEFTELEVLGEGPQRQIRRVSLDDITQAIANHDALVLLGEPGSGKTTTLERLALDAAQRRLTDATNPLPLLLPLAAYRGYASPYAFLEAYWTQQVGTADLAQRLRQGKLFLLCDALNEMPSRDAPDYRANVEGWRWFIGEWPGNRLLFTCRSRDYSEPLGLPQVEIERLDDDRIQDFLRRYLPSELADQAWAQLAGTALLELVRNPYYLAMLAYLVAQGGNWPASRAGLFEGFVAFLLGREQRRNHPDWPDKDTLHRSLALLAESMQPLGEGTRLAREEAVERLSGQANELQGDSVLRLGLAATLLDTALALGGEEQVRFYHHQLQDYFAACALLARFNRGEELSLRWRQPRFVGEMPNPGPLRDDEPLPPPPSTGWEEPTLLAAGLTPQPQDWVAAVRQSNPVLAARCLLETSVACDPAQVTLLQQDLLNLLQDSNVHLRARLDAGETLGILGDPRFPAVQVDGRQLLLPPLVRIPAGSFTMGSGFWEVWRLTKGGFPAQDERPRQRLALPEFYIGRYPVTNAEFACFMESGGYQEERWWTTEQARRWRRGELESGVVEGWLNLWRYLREDPVRLQQQGWTPRTISIWERLLTLEESAFRELANQNYAKRPRDRPAFWDDERYRNPSQPVVGVTWFEAMAYCRWLDVHWRVVDPTLLPDRLVRLPTEVEWERAARFPKSRRYPWGNRWSEGCANTSESHVLRPTAVGIYPAGVTPAGVYDLSGNVREWTLSLYQPYLHQTGDGRNNSEAKGMFVLRGGSWYGNQRLARCAARYRDPPGDFNVGWGFRIVLSLADSDF